MMIKPGQDKVKFGELFCGLPVYYYQVGATPRCIDFEPNVEHYWQIDHNKGEWGFNPSISSVWCSFFYDELKRAVLRSVENVGAEALIAYGAPKYYSFHSQGYGLWDFQAGLIRRGNRNHEIEFADKRHHEQTWKQLEQRCAKIQQQQNPWSKLKKLVGYNR